MTTDSKQLVKVDHESGTVTFAPDIEIEQLGEGYRVTAPWYDGEFTTSTGSEMWVGENLFNLNDMLAAHYEKAKKMHVAEDYPVST